MKTTTLAIAAVMAAGTVSLAGESVVLTLVPEGSADWRYLVGPQRHLPGFAAMDFDDSEWLLGESPFGSGSQCSYPVVTNWPVNTDLLLRRAITMPAAGTARISVAIDNDVQAFLDGVAIGPMEQFEGCAFGFEYQVDYDVAEPGEHILAIRARDRGGASFADIRVEAIISADCNGDGIVDYGQILDGTFEDANANGVPDCCDEGTPCECVGDVNNDGIVNGADISVLLGFWGLNGKPVAADINQDGQVDGTDLANVLGSWGECP